MVRLAILLPLRSYFFPIIKQSYTGSIDKEDKLASLRLLGNDFKCDLYLGKEESKNR